jgi:two-component system, NtrC family, sensor kinase
MDEEFLGVAVVSRFTWQLKAILPAAFVLFNGLLLFLLVTLTVAEDQRQTILTLAGAGAVAICGALLIGLTLVVGKPLLELQQKIARIRDGDLEVTVQFANRNDAVGDLGKNFNNMVRELRESREEIQRLHRTQMSRAEHLATLGELAAGLAHEIRNPLAGIAGVMEIIGRDLPANSPAREVLREVKSEVQHINRILTDLLDTARPKPPEFRPANLNATVEHAVIFAREQALSKPIEIELIKDEGLPEIEHDAGQIHQVLLNLLLNAIQAIKGEGKVTVKVGQRDDYAIVQVEDTGCGIPPETLSHIFRPFYTTKGNGTGLGLPLAKRMVEDHGGRLEVSSEVGRGTDFRVLIPLRRSMCEAVSA